MGNLFASTGLGDEKPHERDVEYCGFAGRRPYERQGKPGDPFYSQYYYYFVNFNDLVIDLTSKASKKRW